MERKAVESDRRDATGGSFRSICPVATKSPIAAEALQRIATFYAIEDRIRGLPAAHRAAVRQTDTRPLIEDCKPWLEARLLEVSKKSGLGKAIRYTLNHWNGLTRFIDDGRIEIDSNTVERSIKPIGLGKKNYLFAGSDVGASYYSSGHALIKEGDFAADLEISGDAIVWPQLRGTQRLSVSRRAG